MNDETTSVDLKLLLRQNAALREEMDRLKSGSGGGTSGGMEARLAKLESDMEYVKRDVGELRPDVKDVRERLSRLEVAVSSLPTKTWGVSALMLLLTLIAALVLFQDEIRRIAHL